MPMPLQARGIPPTPNFMGSCFPLWGATPSLYPAAPDLTRGSGGADAIYRTLREELDGEVFDDGVAEEAGAHLAHSTPRVFGPEAVQLDVHDLADAHVLHLREPQRGQGALHRDALRIQDARLQPDEDAGPHDTPPS